MKAYFCAYDAPDYINGPNVWLQRTLPGLQALGVQCNVLFLRTGREATRAAVGWTPPTSLEAGLRETVAWYADLERSRGAGA